MAKDSKDLETILDQIEKAKSADDMGGPQALADARKKLQDTERRIEKADRKAQKLEPKDKQEEYEVLVRLADGSQERVRLLRKVKDGEVRWDVKR